MLRAAAQQYAEMASFLWTRRVSAARAPHHTLADLAAMDERLDAHLDGLRIAGNHGWTVAASAIGEREPGALFTAAVLAFERGEGHASSLVLDHAESGLDARRELTAAIAHLRPAQAAPWTATLLEARSPALRTVGIGAAAAHRRDPGPALDRALGDVHVPLRCRALRALGELGRATFLDHLREQATSSDRDVRFEAAWSAAVLGDESANPVLCTLAARGGPLAERACHVAFRRMQLAEGRRRLALVAGLAGAERVAVIAAGALGDPAQIPWLVSAMEDPAIARVAGEAFTTITGVALRGDLQGERPPGFRSGPGDDPDDDDVAMDPDDGLPWPRAGAIRELWARRGGSLPGEGRYLLGRPITRESALFVLAHGGQKHRAAAALELAGGSPGSPLFEVRAPSERQRALLRRLDAAGS